MGRFGSPNESVRPRYPSANRTDGSRNAAVDTILDCVALNIELPPRWPLFGVVAAGTAYLKVHGTTTNTNTNAKSS